jgi:hypothetical protein
LVSLLTFGHFSYSALEAGTVNVCAVAISPPLGPFSGGAVVTLKYQGKIPLGQNEMFCFFGSKRVASDSMFYNSDDDTLVSAHIGERLSA